MQLVDVAPLDPAKFSAILDGDGRAALDELIDRAQRLFEGRVLWNINSTAKGGGVAEMLACLLAYARGAGVDTRWVAIPGTPEFFAITKRIHNRLHGAVGDGGPLGEHERRVYERTLAPTIEEVVPLVGAGDVVLVHDPQPAGMVDALRARGALVAWRLHVGADVVDDRVREAWDFVRPYVAGADAHVFSRSAFVWEGLDERAYVVPPSIDVFSAKNQDLAPGAVDAILAAAGLVADRPGGDPAFEREDGSTGRVTRRATVLEDRPLRLDRPLVLQVSRWDALKDHGGVMAAFADHVDADADLVLAGPEAASVADDPEGAGELERIKAAWRALPAAARARVHLAELPMADREENAAIVNALQRHARVIVQKSLAEGFGLTVAEGMWKARPLVAGAVGGIQDQVVEGETGRLVDPHDLAATGAAIGDLLADPARADRMGAAGRERVRLHFTGVRHLGQWVDLVEERLAAVLD
jgi:trehalose synthase